MLRSVVRPLEFRCLNYGDENSKNLTTKLTELILRKGIYPQISSTDTLDSSIYNILTMTWEENERDWLPQLPDPNTLYADFDNKIHDLLYNIICASCGCIGHDRSDYTRICPRPTTFLFEGRTSYSRSLRLFLRNLCPRRTKHYDRSPRDTARRLGLERIAMRHLSSQYHAWEKTP